MSVTGDCYWFYYNWYWMINIQGTTVMSVTGDCYWFYYNWSRYKGCTCTSVSRCTTASGGDWQTVV